jgi:hypothetical protein
MGIWILDTARAREEKVPTTSISSLIKAVDRHGRSGVGVEQQPHITQVPLRLCNRALVPQYMRSSTTDHYNFHSCAILPENRS